MIPRWKAMVGMIAGAMLVLSACAHSFLGWPELRNRMAIAQIDFDLTRGIQVAWHFGGMAMAAFGVIVWPLFFSALKGKAVSLQPALVIGIGHLVLGTWAVLRVESNPFFLLFLIPGALLVLAGWPKK